MNTFWTGILAIIIGVILFWLSGITDILGIPGIDHLFLIIAIILWIGGIIAIITTLR